MPLSPLSMLLNVFSSVRWDPRCSVFLSGSQSTLPTLEIKSDTDVFFLMAILFTYPLLLLSWVLKLNLYLSNAALKS